MITSIYYQDETVRACHLIHDELVNCLRYYEAREEFETCQHIIDTQKIFGEFILGYADNCLELQLIIYLTLRKYFEFHQIEACDDYSIAWFVVGDEFVGVYTDTDMVDKLKSYVD